MNEIKVGFSHTAPLAAAAVTVVAVALLWWSGVVAAADRGEGPNGI